MDSFKEYLEKGQRLEKFKDLEKANERLSKINAKLEKQLTSTRRALSDARKKIAKAKRKETYVEPRSVEVKKHIAKIIKNGFDGKVSEKVIEISKRFFYSEGYILQMWYAEIKKTKNES